MGVLSNTVSQVWGIASNVTEACGPELLQREVSQLWLDVQSLRRILFDLASNRLAVYVLIAAAIYFLVRILFRPVYHLRRNPDVGYITAPRQDRVERANEVRRRRRTGDLPPVYPNGWFRLCEAHELKPKDVRQVSVLGLELAVFRTASGKIGVLDAYCPHLGANLAAGGTVDGESIQCPFHGWEFDNTGMCTKIPYAKDPTKVPVGAKVNSYKVLETNDQILFWYDAEGREPQWYPPQLDEVNEGVWTFRGKTQHLVNAHIQEVPENAADVAHLNYLHGPSLLTGTDLRTTRKSFQFTNHGWEASWAPHEEHAHLSVLKLKHFLQVFGYHLPALDLNVEATQIGPGLVYLTWESLFGKGVFVQSLTPVEPLLQELTHCIYAEWKLPTVIARFYMLGEAFQVERDVMVWNHKMYRSKPLIIKEDELILKHRRWYKQFYSEHSPTYAFQKGGMDW